LDSFETPFFALETFLLFHLLVTLAPLRALDSLAFGMNERIPTQYGFADAWIDLDKTLSWCALRPQPNEESGGGFPIFHFASCDAFTPEARAHANLVCLLMCVYRTPPKQN
jgi:hypothetical protein